MGNIRTRKCHKCKHTSKRKNLVELKNGNPICDMHKKGIPEEIFFKGKTCKDFELAHKYNISKMIGNFMKKINNKQEKDTIKKYRENTVVSINKKKYKLKN